MTRHCLSVRIVVVAIATVAGLATVADAAIAAPSAARGGGVGGGLPTPTVRWNTSLHMGGNEGLAQLSAPLVTPSYVYVTDTFSIMAIDRHSGKFVRSIDCSDQGNCDMFPGGSTTGDLVVAAKKSGEVRAWSAATGRVEWETSVPCQASAFQGVALSHPATDGSILATCVNAMSPVLINGSTGATIATAAPFQGSPWYAGMARASFVPATASNPQAMWVYSGMNTAAFAHPSMALLWNLPTDEFQYASAPPRFSPATGLVYFQDDNSDGNDFAQVVGVEAATGKVRFAVGTQCNNGVELYADRYITCNIPSDGVDNAVVEVHSATDGALTANLTIPMQYRAFGGWVQIDDGTSSSPDASNKTAEAALVGVALGWKIGVASLATGRLLSVTAVNSYYFSAAGSSISKHMHDGVAYLVTPGSVMAIDFV